MTARARNGGAAPLLTEPKRAFIREFMAIRREVSHAERHRLPTVRDMADRIGCSISLFYAIASGRRYARVNPRDVPRGTPNHSGSQL